MIKSRRMRWVQHAAHMREIRNAYKILAAKLEGKIPVSRARRRWEYIKVDFKERC
jgi:hypothetical protein